MQTYNQNQLFYKIIFANGDVSVIIFANGDVSVM